MNHWNRRDTLTPSTSTIPMGSGRPKACRPRKRRPAFRKTPGWSAGVFWTVGMLLVILPGGSLPAAEPPVWRSGWASMGKPEETIAWCRKQIAEMLTACPGLTGVGLDYFGYQNYRCCLCPRSLELLGKYRSRQPELPREKALEEFSQDTLVETINELSRYARGVRPGVKVTIHVYPTFLPEPVYGWRLDVDTCCETVAWFFEPYWSADKIADYTRRVVQRTGSPFPGARGVPFFGLYVGRPDADKPPERLAEELAIIRQHAGLSALSVCSFNEFVKHEAMRRVMKEALADHSATGKTGELVPVWRPLR